MHQLVVKKNFCPGTQCSGACMSVRPQNHDAQKQRGCMPLSDVERESDAACMLTAEADHNSLWSIREWARRYQEHS